MEDHIQELLNRYQYSEEVKEVAAFRVLFRGEGPIILISSVIFWIMLLWIGWVLIFYAVPGAALIKSSMAIPDFTDLVWYIAYCVFTVGNGDLTSNGDFWQVVFSFVALSGMGMVTLAITYLMQVVSAMVTSPPINRTIIK